MYAVSCKIKGVEIGSLIEWEGHISAVVYLAGCNFRCPFCHNPELISNTGDLIPVEDLLKGLKNNWLDAVCLTGGEPTLQEDLPNLIEDIKNLGLKVHLETNGSNPEMVRDLIANELLDYVAMDFKAPTNKYVQVAGINIAAKIEESLDLLLEEKVDYEFRTTLVPNLLSINDLGEMARRVAKAKRFFIQKFSNKQTLDPAYAKIEPYSQIEMLEIFNLMVQSCPNVRVRGI